MVQAEYKKSRTTCANIAVEITVRDTEWNVSFWVLIKGPSQPDVPDSEAYSF